MRTAILALHLVCLSVQADPYTVRDFGSSIGDSITYMLGQGTFSDSVEIAAPDHLWDFSKPWGREEKVVVNVVEPDSGRFEDLFPNARMAVVETHNHGFEKEYYLGGRKELLLYGIGCIRGDEEWALEFDRAEPLVLYPLPLSLGDQWLNSAQGWSGDTLIRLTYSCLVRDTGQVMTEPGIFPCLMLETEWKARYLVADRLIGESTWYALQWVSDCMLLFAGMLWSRDTQKVHRKRMVEYSPAGKDASGEDLNLDARFTGQGILVTYTLPEPAQVTLSCFEPSGRRLWDESFEKDAGEHQYTIIGLYTGVYYVRIDAGARSQMIRTRLPE